MSRWISLDSKLNWHSRKSIQPCQPQMAQMHASNFNDKYSDEQQSVNSCPVFYKFAEINIQILARKITLIGKKCWIKYTDFYPHNLNKMPNTCTHLCLHLCVCCVHSLRLYKMEPIAKSPNLKIEIIPIINLCNPILPMQRNMKLPTW